MRPSIRTVLLSACALAAPLRAQNLLGTWQGTLPSGPSPRLVVNVAKLPDGSLHATLFRPDIWGLSGQPFSQVLVAESHVDMALDLLNISFTGTFSADAKSITGTWTQGKESAPLTLRLTAPADYWLKRPTNRMDPHADPSFEVATIKPTAPDDKGFLFKPRNHTFRVRNFSLLELIKFAYNLQTRQIEGLPSWCAEQHFDITAEADTPGDPVEDQTRVMLRKLLAERFAFKAHLIQKDFPVYALVVEKSPTKLTPATEMEGDHSDMTFMMLPDKGGRAQMVATTMPDFAAVLMNLMPARQIVDRTGLQGRWDFHFDLPAEIFQPQNDPGEREVAFFRGVESLGLKLQPSHASIDVLVVDHIDKPTPN